MSETTISRFEFHLEYIRYIKLGGGGTGPYMQIEPAMRTIPAKNMAAWG